MEIELDRHTILFFYHTLVDLYRDTEDPITLGHSDAMIQVCVERPFVDIYDYVPFPDTLLKASVLLETIINFHPFADGNKRVALLSMFFFLYWNGYDFSIPEDADEYTIEIAKGKHDLKNIYTWVCEHTKRGIYSIVRNLLIAQSLASSSILKSDLMAQFNMTVLFTGYPFMFFQTLIAKKKRQKKSTAK
jgi:death-on-curing protein